MTDINDVKGMKLLSFEEMMKKITIPLSFFKNKIPESLPQLSSSIAK